MENNVVLEFNRKKDSDHYNNSRSEFIRINNSELPFVNVHANDKYISIGVNRDRIKPLGDKLDKSLQKHQLEIDSKYEDILESDGLGSYIAKNPNSVYLLDKPSDEPDGQDVILFVYDSEIVKLLHRICINPTTIGKFNEYSKIFTITKDYKLKFKRLDLNTTIDRVVELQFDRFQNNVSIPINQELLDLFSISNELSTDSVLYQYIVSILKLHKMDVYNPTLFKKVTLSLEIGEFTVSRKWRLPRGTISDHLHSFITELALS